MKTRQQHYHVLLVIRFYVVFLWIFCLRIKPKCVTIQTKAIEQYFHVLLFITLYKVVLSLKSVYETLVCDHKAIEQHCGGGSNF